MNESDKIYNLLSVTHLQFPWTGTKGMRQYVERIKECSRAIKSSVSKTFGVYVYQDKPDYPHDDNICCVK